MSGLEQQVIEPMRRVSGSIQPEFTPSRMQLANVAVGATPAVALQSSADRILPTATSTAAIRDGRLTSTPAGMRK
jgi:hypothetical protein